VTLRCEGTVRGVGGIRLLDDDCASGVPGLYAAGDAASRERVTGAISGGGGPNSSWAIASGNWAGRAAAVFAACHGARIADRPVTPLGRAGLRPATAATAHADADCGPLTDHMGAPMGPAPREMGNGSAATGES
jgi:succinate dehydrogenase/fumarate reductase flavoprotein subunit